MKNKSEHNFRLINILLCIFFVTCAIYGISSITFAIADQAEPNVIISIDNEGHIAQAGSLFGDESWYPGKQVSGVIRINSAGGLEISKLGLQVDLLSFRSGLNKNEVESAFLSNMKLSIKKGKFLVFTDTLIDRASFGQLEAGGGILLNESDRFTISAGDSADLLYTIEMEEEAGNELQDIQAAVSFTINVNEDVSTPPTTLVPPQ